MIRGTSANPDTYFQSREATNPWYNDAYQQVEQAMDDFAAATGRHYKPFEYYGHPQAERVIVVMGSAAGTCEEVIDTLLTRGEKVGVVKVRLFRPFSARHLLEIIPQTVKAIAVLDRTKEPGAQAEPLYLDVMTALAEAYSRGERDALPRTIGGRFGLSSKEFDPPCVLAVFNELAQAAPRPRFTVGIYDDVTSSRCRRPRRRCRGWRRCFTVWAAMARCRRPKIPSRLSVTPRRSSPRAISFTIQKRPGGLTVSHLRVSENPINSAYLVGEADFVGCHQSQFIDKY